jgi:hypothetical protein
VYSKTGWNGFKREVRQNGMDSYVNFLRTEYSNVYLGQVEWKGCLGQSSMDRNV